jgi:hypothetical protein
MNIGQQLLYIFLILAFLGCTVRKCPMIEGRLVVVSTDKWSSEYIVYSSDSAVLAISNSTVHQVYPDGHSIIFIGRQNEMLSYDYLNQILVKEADVVHVGDTIGYAGPTLYFKERGAYSFTFGVVPQLNVRSKKLTRCCPHIYKRTGALR